MLGKATKQGSSRIWPRATSAVWETQGGVRAMANAISLLGRRAFLARLAASGAALGLLSACGGAGHNGGRGAGRPLAPSLAESYEVAPDFKSATFKLRQGIKFHNGDPVTPEDVQFTFEQYRGANAKLLHDKTDRIEIADGRTIRFQFKAPFLDF